MEVELGRRSKEARSKGYGAEVGGQKKYWLVFGLVVILLAVLMLFRPKLDDTTILIIEFNDGELFEIPIQDIAKLEGIDFQANGNRTNDSGDINEILERFYERYRASRGDKLLKVFYIEQILGLTSDFCLPSKLEGLRVVEIDTVNVKRNCNNSEIENKIADFTRYIFHSADGARVMIAPQAHRDFLILMALEFEDGEYSLRLIMPEDSFSQRWLKNVVRIEVRG
jgi:hypothetical protein